MNIVHLFRSVDLSECHAHIDRQIDKGLVCIMVPKKYFYVVRSFSVAEAMKNAS